MPSSISDTRTYQIRVQGHLPESWSEWFGGFDIETRPDGESVLTGEVIDQTALYSLLDRIRDIGLTLNEVKRLDEELENKE